MTKSDLINVLAGKYNLTEKWKEIAVFQCGKGVEGAGGW
jgi:hypothetical protein